MAKAPFDIAQAVPRIGERAEIVASWYLRFNGFFPLTDFVLHDAGALKQPGGQLTDADVLAVRFRYTEELIQAPDYTIEVKPDPALGICPASTEFIIAEVSSGPTKSNWLDADSQTINRQFLEYVLRRFGFWPARTVVKIAKVLSVDKRYEGNGARVRLASFGVTKSGKLPGIEEFTFEEILSHLRRLFGCYGKQPDGERRTVVSDHKQWHPLVCALYDRLVGHRQSRLQPAEVVTWLFPDFATKL